MTSSKNFRATAVAAPDEEFRELYREFVPVLVGFLRSLGAQLPDAADIAQDTIIKAYRSWSKIESPRAWARRVAYREYVHRIQDTKEDPVEHLPERGALLPPHSPQAGQRPWRHP